MPKSISQVLIVGVLAFVLLNVVLAADSTLANSEANASESNGTKIRCMVVDFHSQSAAAIA